MQNLRRQQIPTVVLPREDEARPGPETYEQFYARIARSNPFSDPGDDFKDVDLGPSCGPTLDPFSDGRYVTRPWTPGRPPICMITPEGRLDRAPPPREVEGNSVAATHIAPGFWGTVRAFYDLWDAKCYVLHDTHARLELFRRGDQLVKSCCIARWWVKNIRKENAFEAEIRRLEEKLESINMAGDVEVRRKPRGEGRSSWRRT